MRADYCILLLGSMEWTMPRTCETQEYGPSTILPSLSARKPSKIREAKAP